MKLLQLFSVFHDFPVFSGGYKLIRPLLITLWSKIRDSFNTLCSKIKDIFILMTSEEVSTKIWLFNFRSNKNE